MNELSTILDRTLEHLRQVTAGEITPCSVMTGFNALDRNLCGFNNSDLIVVGSRPGEGKTTYVLACALNQARARIPVLFYSFDQSELQLMQRLIAAAAQIPLQRLANGSLTEEQWYTLPRETKALAALPLYIDSKPPRDIHELCAAVTAAVNETGAKIVYIDHIQLMDCTTSGNSDKRYNGVATITGDLKALARTLEIPVVMTSQMNRRPELRREDAGRYMQPTMYDFRDSGTICEDSNMVIILSRPEAYFHSAEDEEGNDIRGLMEVVIAKHDHGLLTTEKLHVDSASGHMQDWNEHYSLDNLETISSKMNDVPFTLEDNTDEPF